MIQRQRSLARADGPASPVSYLTTLRTPLHSSNVTYKALWVVRVTRTNVTLTKEIKKRGTYWT